MHLAKVHDNIFNKQTTKAQCSNYSSINF